jgi:sugar fermentation stimulation protein A
MIYQNICEGTFLSRSNRFVAKINMDGTVVVAHVKNTGRCKELLISGEGDFTKSQLF